MVTFIINARMYTPVIENGYLHDLPYTTHRAKESSITMSITSPKTISTYFLRATLFEKNVLMGNRSSWASSSRQSTFFVGKNSVVKSSSNRNPIIRITRPPFRYLSLASL